MKTIVTVGMYIVTCLVDDDDYDRLSKYRWYGFHHRNTSYAKRMLSKSSKKMVMMHRDIMNITESSVFIDHKDGNGLNNQKSNLRICTARQNVQNQSKQKTRATSSRYKDVGFDKARNRWRAYIQIPLPSINGESRSAYKSLGRYLSEEEAARAYDRGAIKYFGEFSNVNFIEYEK